MQFAEPNNDRMSVTVFFWHLKIPSVLKLLKFCNFSQEGNVLHTSTYISDVHFNVIARCGWCLFGQFLEMASWTSRTCRTKLTCEQRSHNLKITFVIFKYKLIMSTQTKRILDYSWLGHVFYLLHGLQRIHFQKEYHFYSCICFSQSQRTIYCQLNAKCHTCLES